MLYCTRVSLFLQYLLDLMLLFCSHLEGMEDLLFATLHGRSFVGLFIAQGKHTRITSPLPHGASRRLVTYS